MRRILWIILIGMFFPMSLMAQENIYSFTVKDYLANDYPLRQDSGKVLLIVNSATRCGFTPQYERLEKLYEKYKSEGFKIIDFPCNQFNEQAPGSSQDIHQFCTDKYDITFPQMDKIDVNGQQAAPIYVWLKSQASFQGFGKGIKAFILKKLSKKQDADYKNSPDIKWNFTKFLIDRHGHVIARFEPNHDMDDVEKAIAEALKK